MASPLGRFVVRVIAWLPVAFAVWYFASPLLMWPVQWLLRWVTALTLADLVTGVEQHGAIFTFTTTLRPGSAGAALAAITVEIDALAYAFGMPLLAALIAAAVEPHRMRLCALGYAVLLPVVTWGVLSEFLKNVAITAGPVIASQSGFSAPQREVIAFAFQFGSLILPTVVPAVFWVVTHRTFLEALRTVPARV